MPDPRTNPSPSTQLLMPFDSTRLRGMSPIDRQHAVTRLAILLTEAVGAGEAEQHDERR
jgi:hypothetical protein